MLEPQEQGLECNLPMICVYIFYNSRSNIVPFLIRFNVSTGAPSLNNFLAFLLALTASLHSPVQQGVFLPDGGVREFSLKTSEDACFSLISKSSFNSVTELLNWRAESRFWSPHRPINNFNYPSWWPVDNVSFGRGIRQL